MINLDGGIMLPIPTRAKGFTRPKDINQRRWDKGKIDRWERAYLHCLYSLPLHFDLPLHSVVPRLARKMLEATDSFNIALRFIGEMELAGYVVLKKGYDKRVVMPTKKFLELRLDCERAPESVITYPKLSNVDIPRAPIRGGVSDDINKEVTAVSADMATEEFEINEFILGVVKEFPPEFDKTSSSYMYKRAMQAAEKFRGKKFRFPYFFDSRGRAYTDTTCGFTPQGADHEKAILMPTYKEVLTDDGYDALLEAAAGYSEMDWSPREMADHARWPKLHRETWAKADKPYSYLACARLIGQYLLDASQALPSFVPLDGRCSGLQHWSAVIRSNAITRHLGMHVDEAELDIYEKVAADWRATLPEHLLKYATRKAAKIPVMTWGYNATMMTSIQHIGKLFGAPTKWNDELECFVTTGAGLERTVTGRMGADIYNQLGQTLGPLQCAVEWVSACAVTLSSYGNTEIRWPTPDGFTCLQRKVKGERVQLTVVLSDKEELLLEILDFTKEVPNTGKHKSAIAPNIIHSLDATHLRMVARRLKELGLPMIFIHDSFATHCNHRKILYKIIIDTFIELYSMEYLETLKDYWESYYGVSLESPPKLGDWEPESIRNLDKFFL